MKRLLLILFVLIVPFIWAQSMIPPQYWQEHWYEHNQLLTRQDFTANSVVYYDNDMDPTITWPLQRTSKMWGHAKATYGQSGSDPRLYVILHSGKYLGGHLAYYYEESHDYRNVMDIGQSGSWEEPTGWNIDFIAYLMCIIIESAGTNVRYSPAAGVWHNKFSEIFTYDVYNTLGWTSEAERVKAEFSSNIDDFPRAGTQWFKDWFYPIYTEYGGSTVLGKFFNLMASRLPKDSLGNDQYAYTRGLTLGEIIHFWSGAAGKDLKDLALSAFGTSDEQGHDWITQLYNARLEFSDIGYEVVKNYTPPAQWQEHWPEHVQLLKLQGYTENAAVYYDNDMNPAISWPLRMTSDMWGHVKKTYGGSGSDPRLYVILHSGKYLGGHMAYYYEESHDYRNVMDIGQSGSWEEPTGWNIDILAYFMTAIIDDASRNVRPSPVYPIWHEKFVEIFTYDVYNKLGWANETERVKEKFSSNIDDFPRAGTQWFKDWFYPIYIKYGESTVLGRFFDLLTSRFPKTSVGNDQYVYDRDMNMGEFIHFWSGAARKDLKDFALSVFGTLDEQGNDWRDQLVLAKSDFPRIGYEKRRLRRCRRAVKRR